MSSPLRIAFHLLLYFFPGLKELGEDQGTAIYFLLHVLSVLAVALIQYILYVIIAILYVVAVIYVAATHY